MSRQLLNVSQDGVSTISLGTLCHCSVMLTVKKGLPDIQTEPPAIQFVPTVSCPVTGHYWKDPGSILFLPFFQIFIYIDKIPVEPSFLQAKQSQLFQLFLIREMLESLNYLCGPLLDSLYRMNVSLVLGSPELDTILRVWPHQCWAEWKDCLSQSASYTTPNAAQDTICLCS